MANFRTGLELALMTELKGKGVTFKGDIIHSPVCRMAVCLDSEGNSILLHQLKPKPQH
jgi:predicted enzyme related to lactoylglutathione lyase